MHRRERYIVIQPHKYIEIITNKGGILIKILYSVLIVGLCLPCLAQYPDRLLYRAPDDHTFYEFKISFHCYIDTSTRVDTICYLQKNGKIIKVIPYKKIYSKMIIEIDNCNAHINFLNDSMCQSRANYYGIYQSEWLERRSYWEKRKATLLKNNHIPK